VSDGWPDFRAGRNLAEKPYPCWYEDGETYLLVIFGMTIVPILVLTTAVACRRESALKDLIGFFSPVVAMLGTLLGGVVAFYFARR
jgi:hypothetical protein